MQRFIGFVQAIFFSVSMLLTGLFALSLSGIEIRQATENYMESQVIFLAVLFVLIGCCIDIGKYLFWSQRQASIYYAALSIILMVFSWLASCAFFITSEGNLLKGAQKRTPEYVAIQQKISNLEQEISNQERLLKKRLNSEFHSQWVEGEKNAANIARLRESLVEHINLLPGAGLSTATMHLSTIQLFRVIGDLLGVGLNTIRVLGYGLLALLLEISALGMISLSSTSRIKSNKESIEPNLPIAIPDRVSVIEEHREKSAQLIFDILSRKTTPVLRAIKTNNYGINLSQVRQVLRDLYAIGILEKDIRNSYKISEKFEAL